MSNTSKKVIKRYKMDLDLSLDFFPNLERNFLIDELKKMGGNSFSFNSSYMDHVKFFISKYFDYKKLTVPESLFLFKNELKELPKCYCGNNVKFQGNFYSKTCSKKCNNNSKESNQKRKETFLKKYGNEYIFKSENIKSKIKQTKIKNNTYSGYSYKIEKSIEQNYSPLYSYNELKNILLSEGGSYLYQKPELMDNIKYFLSKNGIDYTQIKTASEMFCIFKNNLKNIPMCVCGNLLKFHQSISRYSKFCSSSCFSNNEINKSNKEKTCLQKYGVSNFSQTEDFKKQNSERQLNENYEEMIKPFSCIIIPKFKKEDYKGKYIGNIYDWKCLRCDSLFKSSFYNNSLNRPRCFNCDGNYTDIELIIKNFLKKKNIKFEYKNRKLLDNNKEIDFFIPSKNIGIEVDGLYFHSENFVSQNYHLEKTNECEFKNIKLIHIFTDEFLYKDKIIESRLKNLFNLIKYKVYARKCVVKEIESKISQKFLEKYHIQGNTKDKIRLGLFYKNKLLSVMTFSKQRNVLGYRKKETDVYELVRFCGTFNIKVIGAASKLLSYFEKKYKPKKIISYADRRWSNGFVYKQLGFNFIKNTKPNYWYTNDFKNRIHRFNFQKHLISKKLKKFDSTKTEHQNMLDNCYYRIYDCGSIKFEKTYL